MQSGSMLVEDKCYVQPASVSNDVFEKPSSKHRINLPDTIEPVPALSAAGLILRIKSILLVLKIKINSQSILSVFIQFFST